MEDLSTFHEPVSDLFSRPSSGEEWKQYTLTDAQLDDYERQGYLAGVRLLNDSQLEELRKETAAVMDPKHPGNSLFYEFHVNESGDPDRVLFHALGAWRIAPGLHDILWNPAFLVPASQLLGGPVRFWHDQLFCKPAHHGGVVAWHQDYSYWTRTEPLAHLTCWIGLDDATLENGCLQYIEGSHKWDLLPITGLAGDMEAIAQVLSSEQRAAFLPVPAELKAGQCSFHHGLTIHGSFANRSARPRRGIVINVVRDGVRSASAEPLLEGVPAVGRDQALGGQFFPLLYSPE